MVTRLVFLVTSRARQLVLLKVKETRPLYPLFFLSFFFFFSRSIISHPHFPFPLLLSPAWSCLYSLFSWSHCSPCWPRLICKTRLTKLWRSSVAVIYLMGCFPRQQKCIYKCHLLTGIKVTKPSKNQVFSNPKKVKVTVSKCSTWPSHSFTFLPSYTSSF